MIEASISDPPSYQRIIGPPIFLRLFLVKSLTFGTQLKRRLINPITGMVSGRGFVVYSTRPVAGKEIIQWRTLQEQTYTRK